MYLFFFPTSIKQLSEASIVAFALTAAQLSMGIVCRLGRAGFSERDVHWMPPMPFDWKDGDPIDTPNREYATGDAIRSETRLLKSAPKRFNCRVGEYIRSRSVNVNKWWLKRDEKAITETSLCKL